MGIDLPAPNVRLPEVPKYIPFPATDEAKQRYVGELIAEGAITVNRTPDLNNPKDIEALIKAKLIINQI